MTTRIETADLTSRPTESIAPRALRALTATDRNVSTTLLRLTLGVVMFPHGAQKMLGWFGGPGFSSTVEGLAQHAGLPAFVAVLVICAEFFGSLALIVGLFSRAATLGIAAVMVGAIFIAHLSNGFFMNWYGAQAGEGYEYHLLAIGIALAIAIKGSGAFSLDGLVSRTAPSRSRASRSG